MRASKKQLNYLRDLGYTGPTNIEMEDASDLINEYKKAREAARKQNWELIQARLFCPNCEVKTKRVLKHKPYQCYNCGQTSYYIESHQTMGTKAEYKKSLQPILTRFVIWCFKLPFRVVGMVYFITDQIVIISLKTLFRIIGFSGKLAFKAGKKAAPMIGKAAVRGAKIAKNNAPAVGAAIAKGATAAKDAAGQGVEYVKRISREYDGVSEYRTWTTADSKHQITAKLVGITPAGKVRLEKEDQRCHEILPQHLCDDDREYLKTAIIDVKIE